MVDFLRYGHIIMMPCTRNGTRMEKLNCLLWFGRAYMVPHGSTWFHLAYRQFTGLQRGQWVFYPIVYSKLYTEVPHVSICNATGDNLTSIVQATCAIAINSCTPAVTKLVHDVNMVPSFWLEF